MTPESRVSAAAYGAEMKKLIIPFYMLSLYTPILWFGSVFKHQVASNSILHIVIGVSLAAFPMYVMFHSDIKVKA